MQGDELTQRIQSLMERREELTALINEAQTEVAVIDAELAELSPEDGFDFMGRKYRMKRSTKNRWDDHGLLMRLAEKAVADRVPDENGVVADPVSVLASSLEKVASIAHWRVQELRNLDIDPQDYRDVEWGRPRPVAMEVVP